MPLLEGGPAMRVELRGDESAARLVYCGVLS